MSAINYKAVYDMFYKADYIPLSETIVRLNMLASFIENHAKKMEDMKTHMISDDTTGRKENLERCSIVECAAQTEAFNDLGLWMTSKESTNDRYFILNPYPHFQTFYKLTYAPGATTQIEADEFHKDFYPMSVFFGLHPAVYKYLLSALNYEYDFGIFNYTIIHWLKSLEIPEVYWTTLNLEVKHGKYVRFGPIDVAKRIRHFVSILEQSPLTSTYEATYNMLDISEGELESEANRMTLKVKRFMQKVSIFNFFANRSQAV